MKKILLSLVAIATISLSSFGQAPEGFKYQAVVRDAGNLILNNQAVGMQITIQQGGIGGTAVYTETFAITTNTYGLVNLEIGTGTTTDDFSIIDWSAGPYFIETAVDVTGGTSYAVMGTSQLMSVPYALYAKTAENVTNDLVDDADADPNNEIQAVSFSNDTLYLSNGGQVYLGSYGVDLVDDADADPNNEIQDLQLLGNILTITNNGTATSIDLSSYLDNTDTQLDETAVDAFVANNGYITSPNDADADPNNEIQAVSFSNDTLYLSNGGQVYLGAYSVDLVDDADADAMNEIQDLQLLGNILTITNNGTATSIDLSGYLDNTDTQLDETAVDGFVSNNGYITSPNDADADPNNEIQAVSFSNDTLYLSNGGQVYLGSYGVDLVDDADADAMNEIQDLQLLGNILTITNNGTATSIDLSGYLDNTDTQLDETAVDAFVSNNGYITSPDDADSDPTNEIELPSGGQEGQILTIIGGVPTWVNPSCGLSIGDLHAGGIIFYLDGTGCHGLVAATSDQSTGDEWGCFGTLIAGADGTAIGTGNQNTIDIEAGCPTAGTAADICTNLALAGYTDWFLPSKDELNLMYQNIGEGNVLGLGNIGGFAPLVYWSSTEFDNYTAWFQGFLNGFQNLFNKNDTYYVRAVRAF